MSTENKEDQNSKSNDAKEDEPSEIEEQKNVNESSKDSGKDSPKQSEKEESENEESEEEMGLLDRPVEVTGSRERKKVQRLDVSFVPPAKDKLEIPEGGGKKLGECPRIEFQIQKNKVNELKPLYKILFNRAGSATEIKKNIRKFCGFAFAEDSPEFKRKKLITEKLTSSVLKKVCEVLDLERGGTKEDIVTRILQFLLLPKESGKGLPKKSKKKISSKGEKKGSVEKKPKGSGEKTNKKKKDKSSDEEEDESPVEEDSAAEDSDVINEVDESDEEPPKKKSKGISKAKESLAKGKKAEKNSNKSKKEEKKVVTKSGKRKRGEDSEESSDDEPLAKKNKMPSDDDIKTLVKAILDTADLQEITMKKVIKKVADAYPDFDLSDKKDFIKSTVKSVIS